MAADQLGDGGPLDRAYASRPVYARIDQLVTAGSPRIGSWVDIPLRRGLHLRGAVSDLCERGADGAAHAGVRRIVRLDHGSIAMVSHATRSRSGNFRGKSAQTPPGAIAKSDHPYHFWPGSLLLLSNTNQPSGRKCRITRVRDCSGG